jgi:hypothetical protein
MIVVAMFGGLGNQLFQYASARALAARRGTELVLDTGWYDNIPASATKREFELSRYPLSARIATPFEAAIGRMYWGRILRRLPMPRPWPVIRDKEQGFDPALLGAPDRSYLYGYWQSHRYFEDIAGLLRSELVPSGDPTPGYAELAAHIRATNSVSVHVRRGDYVSNPQAAKLHGTCTPAYYERAIGRMTAEVPEAHFYVFSDDPAWARENLVFERPATIVDFGIDSDACRDLWLMSLCRHHIVANSSFSWWGAWLAGRPDGLVLAPEHWYSDGRELAEHIPQSWQRVAG